MIQKLLTLAVAMLSLMSMQSAAQEPKAAGKNRYQLAAETGQGRHEAIRAS